MFVNARLDKSTIKIVCPYCKYSSMYDISFIEAAIYATLPVWCVACTEKFTILTACQIRDAQLRNEADEAGHDCPICNDSGIDPDSPDGLERPCPNCDGQS